MAHTVRGKFCLARGRNNSAAFLLKLFLSLMSLCFGKYQIQDGKESSRINPVRMVRHRKEDNAHHSTQTPVGPIERFFESFSNFRYSPSKPSAEEYQRLRKLNGWKRGDSEGKKAWLGFRLALVKEFNRLFGTDPNDLLAWQTLCIFIGIRERFTTCDDYVQVRLVWSSHVTLN